MLLLYVSDTDSLHNTEDLEQFAQLCSQYTGIMVGLGVGVGLGYRWSNSNLIRLCSKESRISSDLLLILCRHDLANDYEQINITKFEPKLTLVNKKSLS